MTDRNKPARALSSYEEYDMRAKATAKKEAKASAKNKRTHEKVDISEVKSANKWEKADLDTEQKSKFLKLMGAAKKEHTGRFVIGASGHSRSRSKSEEKDEGTSSKDDTTAERAAPESKQLNSELESQYSRAMGSHLRHRDDRHCGLGWNRGTEVDLKGTTPDVRTVPAPVSDNKKSKLLPPGGKMTFVASSSSK